MTTQAPTRNDPWSAVLGCVLAAAVVAVTMDAAREAAEARLAQVASVCAQLVKGAARIAALGSALE